MRVGVNISTYRQSGIQLPAMPTLEPDIRRIHIYSPPHAASDSHPLATNRCDRSTNCISVSVSVYLHLRVSAAC